MDLADCATLWRAGRRRMRSARHYRRFQAVQADLLGRYLARAGVPVAGRTMLDLGCGIGGYSDAFARRGARVIAVDVAAPHLPPDPSVVRVRARAEHLPLRPESVDVVFCASLVEHVPRPEEVLDEIVRVLRIGGVAYVSFPPYYSPRGGHQFSPYHYLGERVALRLARRRSTPEWVRESYGGSGNPRAFSEVFADWGLYRMTIRRFRTLVDGSGLRVREVGTRYLPVSFVRWPLLGDC